MIIKRTLLIFFWIAIMANTAYSAGLRQCSDQNGLSKKEVPIAANLMHVEETSLPELLNTGGMKNVERMYHRYTYDP